MKPVIVCLCGSTRFEAEYIEAQKAETLAGRIVLSVGLFGHKEGIDMTGPVKAMLDELHLRKIDLADEILVINPPWPRCQSCKAALVRKDNGTFWPACGCFDYRFVPFAEWPVEIVGYVGDSTRREIAYAEAHGKRIRYFTIEEVT